MTTAAAIFLSKDQDWTRESTTYWFTLAGEDYGTNKRFDGDVFGVVECGSDDPTFVDCDGMPMTPGDAITIAVRKACIVTDDMRQS